MSLFRVLLFVGLIAKFWWLILQVRLLAQGLHLHILILIDPALRVD
ncbi:MAG: hypothetical protein ACLPYO_01780 [Mycobacterium sp.]